MSDLIHAELVDGKIHATAKTFSGRDMVALIPGAKWREGHWELPVTWAAVKQLRYTFGEDLEIGKDLEAWGWTEYNDRVSPCMMMREVINTPFPEDHNPKLYPYQAAGADFLAVAQHAILSDPPGAGKTAQAISAALALEEYYEQDALPALVIAPKSTLISWAREVETWWPGTPTYVVNGTPKKRAETILQAKDQPGFVIINWESVRLHSRLSAYGSMRLRTCIQCDKRSTDPPRTCERCNKELNEVPWKLVIADEAQRMANSKSKQTRAVWALGDQESVDYRWALTGTPLTNQVDTLWPILRFLNKEEHPSRVAFIDRYALTRPIPWGAGVEVIGMNPANEDEFQEIFQPRFRRMLKEIILPQLPPIQRARRYIEMTEKQAALYARMAEEMLAVTDTGELIIAANPAVKMLRMVQFASACADVTLGNDEELHTRLRDPSNKLDALMDDLPDLLEAGESVVVFAVSRQLIELAEERLKKVGYAYSVIKGDQSMAERQYMIDSFQDGLSKICLVVIAAGGVGVTLTAGRIAIFLQRSWSYVENHQAEGRIHRIGSEKHESIEIIDYISQNTVDSAVAEVAEGKALKLEEIVRDQESLRKLLHGEVDRAGSSDGGSPGVGETTEE